MPAPVPNPNPSPFLTHHTRPSPPPTPTTQSKHLEAVHLALVLSHYDLLADLPSSSSAGPQGGAQAGPSAAAMLETLVVGYIKDFKGTDPQVAADYLLRLRPPERLERGVEALLVELEDEGSRKALAEYLKVCMCVFVAGART